MQKIDTKKGTHSSISTPCITARGIASFPEYRAIAESETSAEAIPAAEIGAKYPKYLRNIGAPMSAVISRKIFANRAIVPNSVATCTPNEADFSSVIRIEDTE